MPHQPNHSKKRLYKAKQKGVIMTKTLTDSWLRQWKFVINNKSWLLFTLSCKQDRDFFDFFYLSPWYLRSISCDHKPKKQQKNNNNNNKHTQKQTNKKHGAPDIACLSDSLFEQIIDLPNLRSLHLYFWSKNNEFIVSQIFFLGFLLVCIMIYVWTCRHNIWDSAL